MQCPLLYMLHIMYDHLMSRERESDDFELRMCVWPSWTVERAGRLYCFGEHNFTADTAVPILVSAASQCPHYCYRCFTADTTDPFR